MRSPTQTESSAAQLQRSPQAPGTFAALMSDVTYEVVIREEKYGEEALRRMLLLYHLVYLPTHQLVRLRLQAKHKLVR